MSQQFTLLYFVPNRKLNNGALGLYSKYTINSIDEVEDIVDEILEDSITFCKSLPMNQNDGVVFTVHSHRGCSYGISVFTGFLTDENVVILVNEVSHQRNEEKIIKLVRNMLTNKSEALEKIDSAKQQVKTNLIYDIINDLSTY